MSNGNFGHAAGRNGAHTPGPWRLFDKNDTRTMVLGPKGFHVASVPVFEQEDEANARLIAAAPDLLAMLKVAQLWLDVDGRYDMQGINAAIAKATQP